MYKLIAVDMDGTLLNSNGRISDENLKSIHNAINKGVKVVFTTGRGIKAIDTFIKEAKLSDKNEYVITNNGVALYSTNTLKCISSYELNSDEIREICEVGKKLDADILIYDYESESSIFLRDSKYVQFETKHIGMPVSIIYDYCETLTKDKRAFKVLFVGEKEVLDSHFENIPKEIKDKYNIVRTLPNTLEIFNKSCNKGNAVKALAEKFNILREEIICIGDQQNDFEMIQYAGLGVAMGNAIDKIKELADYITDTNDNDGVAKVIKKFVL